MKVLITANNHPQYDRVGTITGHLPPSVLGDLVEPSQEGKTLFAIEFGNGQRGTAFEGEFKLQDSGDPTKD